VAARATHRKGLMVTAVLLAVAVAAAGIVWDVWRGSPASVAAPVPTASSTPTTAPEMVPSAVPTLTATPTPTPTPVVEAAPPTHVTIPSLGLDAAVLPYTAADAKKFAGCYSDGKVLCIEPPTDANVYWSQTEIAGIPFENPVGTDTQGTAYLFGHATDSGSGVFTRLYQMQAGQIVLVSTANGQLTYQVDQVETVLKPDFGALPVVTEQVPGELLLVTCNHGPGATIHQGSSTENLIVVTHLVSAQPAQG